MTYQFRLTNNSILTNVAPTTLDSSASSLTLIGKDFINYGEILQNQTIFLLENFANDQPPPNPLIGQQWYDSASNRMRFWDGGSWLPINNLLIDNIEDPNTALVGVTDGQFYFDEQRARLWMWKDEGLVGVENTWYFVGGRDPQLEGDLNVNGFSIVSQSGGDIVIDPDGAGRLILSTLSFPTVDGVGGQYLRTDGAGTLFFGDPPPVLTLIDESGPALGGDLDTNGFTIFSSGGNDIAILPDVGGNLFLDQFRFPLTDGSANQVMTTDGSGNLFFQDAPFQLVNDLLPFLGGPLNTNGSPIVSNLNEDLEINPGGTGRLILQNATWPNVDGNVGDYLATDGSDNLSFQKLDISRDDDPVLGGDLDVANFALLANGTDNIEFVINGTGNIILDGLFWPEMDGAAGQFLQTDGAGVLSFASVMNTERLATDNGSQSGSVNIDTATATFHAVQVTGNLTINFINPPSPTNSREVILYIDNSSGFLVDYTASGTTTVAAEAGMNLPNHDIFYVSAMYNPFQDHWFIRLLADFIDDT